ncbi:hypothetical protein BGW80DRAFT_827060 [Lactifluus volemus]|nr:hypothetical protein BGW80DRAFT_827060 [Lactifluus volemus]
MWVNARFFTFVLFHLQKSKSQKVFAPFTDAAEKQKRGHRHWSWRWKSGRYMDCRLIPASVVNFPRSTLGPCQSLSPTTPQASLKSCSPLWIAFLPLSTDR